MQVTKMEQKMLDELAYGDICVVTDFSSHAARIAKLEKLREKGLVTICRVNGKNVSYRLVK